MIKWNLWIAAVLLAGAALTGCISADYVGQSFPELPPGTYIAYFDEDRELPDDTYKMIGQVRLTGKDSVSKRDFRDKLMALAEKHGADAVKVTRSVSVLTEDYVESIGNSDYEPTSDSGLAGDGIGGTSIGSFGEPLPARRVEIKRRKTVIDAKLLVRTNRFDAMMAKRRAERQAQLNPPAPESDEPIGIVEEPVPEIAEPIEAETTEAETTEK